MPQGLIQPANAILYAGEPLYQEFEVLTTTHMAPGRLVITDTNDYSIKVAGAGAATCLGVLDIMADEKLTLMQTEVQEGTPLAVYAAGTQVRVIRGDVVVKCMGDSGATIAVGTKLITAANGMVTNGTTAGQVIGYSLQAITFSGVCKWVLVKLTI